VTCSSAATADDCDENGDGGGDDGGD
jgi:hypothetical protein